MGFVQLCLVQKFAQLCLVYKICTSVSCFKIARGRVKRSGKEKYQNLLRSGKFYFFSLPSRLTRPLGILGHRTLVQINLIDKPQLFKSYRQGSTVQILFARHDCANLLDKAQLGESFEQDAGTAPNQATDRPLMRTNTN